MCDRLLEHRLDRAARAIWDSARFQKYAELPPAPPGPWPPGRSSFFTDEEIQADARELARLALAAADEVPA